MTNAIGANAVVVYRRAADGTLTLADTVPTGGGGSGVQLDPTDSLGSQGALALSEDTNYLFAANTETVAEDTDHDCTEGSISAFRVGGMGGLARTEAPIASGGLFPSSIAVRDGKVYVLNSGGPDICDGRPGFDPYPNITGFTIEAGGVLRRIPGASQRVDPGLGDGCAPAGFGATDHGVTLLAARGIDISRHQARPLTDALLREADLILVMEEAHRSAIARQAPQHLAKVRLFTELAGGRDDVADPVGGTLDDYRRTLAGMDAVLDQGWTTLLAALPPVDTPPPDVRPPD